MPVDVTSLRRRIDGLRAPVVEVARRAGLDHNTVHRVLKRRRGTITTLDRIEQAVAGLEQEMAAHLRGLPGEAQP